MRKKRLLSLLLAAVMVLTLFSGVGGTAKAAKPGYYDIEFRSNGYSGESNIPAKIEIKDGALYTIPTSPIPSRPGYTCIGYSTTKGGNVVTHAFGKVIRVSESLILYPVYSGSGQYAITYVADGGTNIPASTTVASGAKYTIPNNQPERSKYLFRGWSRKSNAAARTVDYNSGQPITVTSNLTLYPVWEKNQFATHIDGPTAGNTQLNTFSTLKYTAPLYIGSDSFKMWGWTIFDRGVQSFSYRIVDNDTGKTVKIENPNQIKLRTSVEKGLIAERDKYAKKKGFETYAECVRYELDVPNDKLPKGNYTLWVTATPKAGKSVDVAKMTFTIQNKYSVQYYSSAHQGIITKEQICFYNQVLSASDCEEVLGASKVKYGYRRVWYNKFDKSGDRFEEISMPLKVTKPIKLYYEDKPNTCVITFKYTNETVYKNNVKMCSGDTLDMTYIGKPSALDSKKTVFVGWSEDKDAVAHEAPIYLPEHTVYFNTSGTKKTLYAIFIPENQSLLLNYRLNYWDLSRTRAWHNAHILKSVQEDLDSATKKDSIIKTVGTVVKEGVSFVAKKAKNPKVKGIAIAAGWLFDKVIPTEDPNKDILTNIKQQADAGQQMLEDAWNTRKKGVIEANEHLLNAPQYDTIMKIRVGVNDGTIGFVILRVDKAN